MTEDQAIQSTPCDCCDGKGRVTGHCDYRDDQGRRRGEWGNFKCPCCDGTGIEQENNNPCKSKNSPFEGFGGVRGAGKIDARNTKSPR